MEEDQKSTAGKQERRNIRREAKRAQNALNSPASHGPPPITSAAASLPSSIKDVPFYNNASLATHVEAEPLPDPLERKPKRRKLASQTNAAEVVEANAAAIASTSAASPPVGVTKAPAQQSQERIDKTQLTISKTHKRAEAPAGSSQAAIDELQQKAEEKELRRALRKQQRLAAAAETDHAHAAQPNNPEEDIERGSVAAQASGEPQALSKEQRKALRREAKARAADTGAGEPTPTALHLSQVEYQKQSTAAATAAAATAAAAAAAAAAVSDKTGSLHSSHPQEQQQDTSAAQQQAKRERKLAKRLLKATAAASTAADAVNTLVAPTKALAATGTTTFPVHVPSKIDPSRSSGKKEDSKLTHQTGPSGASSSPVQVREIKTVAMASTSAAAQKTGAAAVAAADATAAGAAAAPKAAAPDNNKERKRKAREAKAAAALLNPASPLSGTVSTPHTTADRKDTNDVDSDKDGNAERMLKQQKLAEARQERVSGWCWLKIDALSKLAYSAATAVRPARPDAPSDTSTASESAVAAAPASTSAAAAAAGASAAAAAAAATAAAEIARVLGPARAALLNKVSKCNVLADRSASEAGRVFSTAAARLVASSHPNGTPGGVITPSSTSWREESNRTDLKRGLFSVAEKQTLMESAQQYCNAHGIELGELGTAAAGAGGKKSGEYVWSEIAGALPNRSQRSCRDALLRLLPSSFKKGSWTQQETESLLAMFDSLGPTWVVISEEMDRSPWDCRDKWRDMMHGKDRHTGAYSEAEDAKLRMLVKRYLAIKSSVHGGIDATPAAHGEKEGGSEAAAADHVSVVDPTDIAEQRRLEINAADGMVGVSAESLERAGLKGLSSVNKNQHQELDGINWVWVAKQMGNRGATQCRLHWYDVLAPSMTERGDWGPGDDKRLLKALWVSGAVVENQSDWGTLVAGRGELQCRQRWRLMMADVPAARECGFDACLRWLVAKYIPSLAGASAEPAGE